MILANDRTGSEIPTTGPVTQWEIRPSRPTRRNRFAFQARGQWQGRFGQASLCEVWKIRPDSDTLRGNCANHVIRKGRKRHGLRFKNKSIHLSDRKWHARGLGFKSPYLHLENHDFAKNRGFLIARSVFDEAHSDLHRRSASTAKVTFLLPRAFGITQFRSRSTSKGIASA
jgi:hypothetical protein